MMCQIIKNIEIRLYYTGSYLLEGILDGSNYACYKNLDAVVQ